MTNETAVDVILHPVRMRIIQYLINQKLTAQQLKELLPDIPQASMYRNLKKLVESGVIHIVDEIPNRGTVEKVYSIHNPSKASISPEDLKKFSKEEIKLRAEETLKLCGLYPFRNWPIQALSYGQKKRLTIASVLITNPKLIVLDEPTAGQDYYHYKQFMSFIRKLAEKGISFIIITHDMNLALEYADRAVVLHEGKIIADNTVSAVLGDQGTLQRANLRESSLIKLAKLSGIPTPETFVKLYIEDTRREEYA